MNKELLNKAIKVLSINDVYLNGTRAVVKEGVEPKFDTELFDSLEARLKHIIAKSNVVTISADGDQEVNIFRVVIRFGAFWIPQKTTEENFSEESIQAIIEAEMICEYIMNQNPGQDALNEFALHNASFHAWPFWREYLSSQCLRMHLPQLMLPTMMAASNSETGAKKHKTKKG